MNTMAFTESNKMKRFTRDETKHGQEYYLASDVDKALAQGETSSPRAAQEPVAWLVTFRRETGTDTLIVKSRERAELEVNPSMIVSVEPLATPPVQPAQRPWVGLTDENMETLILKHAPPLHSDYEDDSLHGLLQAANDFLKELNT
jgi:hypothetical protein